MEKGGNYKITAKSISNIKSKITANTGKLVFLALFVAVLLAFSGCKPVFNETNATDSNVSELMNDTNLNTENLSINNLLNNSENKAKAENAEENKTSTSSEEKETEEEREEETEKETSQSHGKEGETENSIITKVFDEGDLVVLKPRATDADNDTIIFSFSEPLDEKGEWQTKQGDAGTYIVTVSASDGKATVSKKVRIIIKPKNHAPVIEIGNITVKEGETVYLAPKVKDIDNDSISIKFSGWMTSNSYKTNYNDAGSHKVIITASDGKATVKKTITVFVENVNRAPIIKGLFNITAKEGDTIKLSPMISDPDNDKVSIDYSEPFNKEGIWENAMPGSYVVTVKATDGKATTEKTIGITVAKKNHAPVIEISDIVVSVSKTKGSTVKLNPKVYDEDNDKVTVTYSGWMDSATKNVTYEEAGTHKVTITASDGKSETSKEVLVTVNRAPEFTI